MPANLSTTATMPVVVPTPRSAFTTRLSVLWTLAGLAALLLVAAAGRWAEHRETQVQVDALRRAAEVHAVGLRAALSQFEHLPHAIAQHQDVVAVLAAPLDAASRDRANRFLQNLALKANLSALYVMDTSGTTVAASNWDSPTSFVGESYRDRPYFVAARNGRMGQFYGVGLTTGIPGYFIAGPVRRQDQSVVGVVAAKLSLESIEAAWAQARDPIALSDSRAIVFLGNVPEWMYRSMRPLTEMELEWLRYYKQYGERSHFEPLPCMREPIGSAAGFVLRCTVGGQRRTLLAIAEPLPELGWTLTLTADHSTVLRARNTAWALSSLALLALLLAGLYWRLRERRAAEQRTARLDLEQRVSDRTRELQDARGYWQAMEDSLLVGMRARDLEGRLIYVNPALCDMLGYSADELVGCMPPYPYWHPDDLAKHWRDNEAVITGKAALNGFESRVRHRDGHDVITMVYTAPLTDASGRQSGWMSSVVDISAQRQVEERQRAQQAQLQKATRLLSLGEMASTLAHELSQPLMALSNFAAAAQAFAEQGPKSMLIASLGDISAQAQRAGEIVTRIRGFVRQRSGGVESVQMSEVVASVLALVEPERRSRKARIDNQVATTLPPVRGDRVLLEQVLLNLVLNGLQATQPMGASRRVVQIDTSVAADTLTVRVTDHGPGISAEVASHLFEAFFTSKADGLGLGLNICRTIVEGHGGHLGFDNRAEGGAVFFFTLPLST